MNARMRSQKLLHGKLCDTHQQKAQSWLLVTIIGTLGNRLLGTRMLGT
jgi:hypothetical protein